jgi:hypothetical protein
MAEYLKANSLVKPTEKKKTYEELEQRKRFLEGQVLQFIRRI